MLDFTLANPAQLTLWPKALVFKNPSEYLSPILHTSALSYLQTINTIFDQTSGQFSHYPGTNRDHKVTEQVAEKDYGPPTESSSISS
jgi:hypothetical protein